MLGIVGESNVILGMGGGGGGKYGAHIRKIVELQLMILWNVKLVKYWRYFLPIILIAGDIYDVCTF